MYIRIIRALTTNVAWQYMSTSIECISIYLMLETCAEKSIQVN